jgi:hypothetical protein
LVNVIVLPSGESSIVPAAVILPLVRSAQSREYRPVDLKDTACAGTMNASPGTNAEDG